MIFETLKERCDYLRSLGEQRLIPNGHILMMLDGRSFSRLVKKKFKRPFDAMFIGLMNMTAQYLCENISGVKFAYVQSDEISLYIEDKPSSGSFFGLRTSKLLSIAAAMAAGRFNQLFFGEETIKRLNNENPDIDWKSEMEGLRDFILERPPFQFDCKVWNVPTENDVYAWFLYRQLDCIRNSKQQTAQTWLPHRELEGKSSDLQIETLKRVKDIDWNTFEPEVKYGRLIQKVDEEVKIPEQYVKDGNDTTIRGVWKPFPMWVLSEEDGKKKLMELIKLEKDA